MDKQFLIFHEQDYNLSLRHIINRNLRLPYFHELSLKKHVRRSKMFSFLKVISTEGEFLAPLSLG